MEIKSWDEMLECGLMNEVLSSIPIEMPIEEVLNTLIRDVEDYTTDEEQDNDITLGWWRSG